MLNPRRVAVAVLLAFVAASAAYLVASESRSEPEPSLRTGADAPLRASQVVASYFHGRARCVTCQRLESYAEEALQAGFARELADGRLAWRTVDISQPANRHFATDYQLQYQSVILEELKEGQAVRWRNLDQIWQRVPDKEDYMAYVQREVRRFMEGE